MRRLWLILAGLLAQTVLGQELSPRLRVLPESAAMVLGHGSIGKVEYRLINEGEAPIEIDCAYTLCDCSAIALSARQILPGETSIATLTFDSSEKPPPRDRAQHPSGARIYPRGGAMRPLVLTVDVVQRFRFVPQPGVVFRQTAADGSATAELEIYPQESGVEILSASLALPYLTSSLEKISKNGLEGYLLKVRWEADAPPGALSTRLELATTSKAQPLISIPIVGRRPSALVFDRQLIEVVQGESVKREIFGPQGRTLPIRTLRTPPWLDARLRGNELTLTAKLPPEDSLQAGFVRILFEQSDEPVAEIPVIASRRPLAHGTRGLRAEGASLTPLSGEISWTRHRPGDLRLRRSLELAVQDSFAIAGIVGSASLDIRRHVTDRRAIFEIGTRADAPPGLFASLIAIDYRGRRFFMPVYGEVAQDLDLQPAALRWGPADGRRSLYLVGKNAAEAALEFQGLALDADEIRPGGRRLIFSIRGPEPPRLVIGGAEVDVWVSPDP